MKWSLPSSRSAVRYITLLLEATAIWLEISAHSLAQHPSKELRTPEDWAWAQIREGRLADFNTRCGTPRLKARADDERWKHDCRRLPAAFLVDLLTRAPRRSEIPFAGVKIAGARIEGDIDLRNAKLDRALLVEQSRIENNIDLTGVRTDSIVGFMGSRVAGTVSAVELRCERSLSLKETEFKQVVVLDNANIDGTLNLDETKFEATLRADTMHVKGNLFMRSATFKTVNVGGVNVAGQIDLERATFDGHVIADSVRVGAELLMRNIIAGDAMDIDFAHIGGNLDLRGATLADLNLSATSVAGDLVLGNGADPTHSTIWRTKEGNPGKLNLGNTRVANLMDSKDAWPKPEYLILGGFSFSRLGGYQGTTGAEMRGRGANWWVEWLRRDSSYDPASYDQIAGAFLAAGDRDAANTIRYSSRVRQREHEKDWGPWLLSSVFQYTAGFGIGQYTFRVLYWVIGISLGGALYLRLLVRAGQQHGVIWCYGASLSRLLPIVEINREFTDFFNDPDRERLTGFDSFVFSVIAMLGWLLGAILVAAVSGLVPKG